MTAADATHDQCQTNEWQPLRLCNVNSDLTHHQDKIAWAELWVIISVMRWEHLTFITVTETTLHQYIMSANYRPASETKHNTGVSKQTIICPHLITDRRYQSTTHHCLFIIYNGSLKYWFVVQQIYMVVVCVWGDGREHWRVGTHCVHTNCRTSMSEVWLHLPQTQVSTHRDRLTCNDLSCSSVDVTSPVGVSLLTHRVISEWVTDCNQSHLSLLLSLLTTVNSLIMYHTNVVSVCLVCAHLVQCYCQADCALPMCQVLTKLTSACPSVSLFDRRGNLVLMCSSYITDKPGWVLTTCHCQQSLKSVNTRQAIPLWIMDVFHWVVHWWGAIVHSLSTNSQ